MATLAPHFQIHRSAKEPGEGIWFAVPAGFTMLPLEALLAPQDSAQAERSWAILAPLLASAPNEATRLQFMAQLADEQRLLHTLYAKGAVHCAVGLHRDDTGEGDGGALLSMFTITWVDTAWAPRGVTAGRAVAKAEGHTNIEYAELACGPTTFSEAVLTPTRDSALPQRSLLQIHAYVPYPDGRSLANLTLSTTSVAHRPHYRAILRQIAEMVSFEDPFTWIAKTEAEAWER